MSDGEVIHTSKTGGQKAGNDVRMSLVPIRELLQIAELYGRGAAKYEAWNWAKGYEWSKSYDSLWRHMGEFWDGHEMDDGEGGTGMPHLTCAAFHIFSLLYFSKHHRDLDDRPNTVMKPATDCVVYDHPTTAAVIGDIHIHNPLEDASPWTVDSVTALRQEPPLPRRTTRATRLDGYLTHWKWISESSDLIYWFEEGEWWFADPNDDDEDPWMTSVYGGSEVPEREGPFVPYLEA